MRARGQWGGGAAGRHPGELANKRERKLIDELAHGAAAIAPFGVTPKTVALATLPVVSDGQDWSGYAGIVAVDY